MSDLPKPTRRGQLVMRRPLPPDAMAYRVPDAAARIGVSTSKLWKMIADGDIPARKTGAATVIRHEDLKAFVDSAPVRTPISPASGPQ